MMISFQMNLAEIRIKDLSEQARLVTLDNNVDKFSIKSQHYQSVPVRLIVRFGGLLIMTGHRHNIQIKTA